MKKANRAWVVMVGLMFMALGYQNCGEAGNSIFGNAGDIQVRTSSASATPTPVPTIGGTPRINPNPDQDGATPTPTPPPIATAPPRQPTPVSSPQATPNPTPVVTPVPLEVVRMMRYFSTGTGDHILAPEGSNVVGYTPDGVIIKLYKNPGTSRQKLYQCEAAGGAYHMITIHSNCEGGAFYNAGDLGGYVSMQQNDGGATIQLFRKYNPNFPYLQLPTTDPNEAQADYPVSGGVGFMPQ